MFLILFYYLALTVAMCTCLSYHLYYSFISPMGNSYLCISLSTMVMVGLICGFLSKSLFFWERILPSYIRKTIEICVYFFMAFLLYSVFIYIILDFINFFVHSITPKEKGFIALSGTFIILMIGYINTRFIRYNYYTIFSNKITKDTHIVLVSDLHIGALDMTLSKMNRMVKCIKKLSPDIIIIAGDLVDDATQNIEAMGFASILNKLQAREGIFATTGNHEYYNHPTSNISVSSLDDIIRSLGENISLLDNQEHHHTNLNLNIIGISDKGLKKERNCNLTDFQLDQNIFNLVVEHNPINFEKNIQQYPIDLQLSGHTHAGQLFLACIVELFLFKKPWGILKIKGSTLITSCGVGSWGPPIRDISYPEIVSITIKKSL